MGELLCHLFGDYVIQNHQMATKKTSSSLWEAIHAVTYTLPFLFLTQSPLALAIICGTHFIIDRFRLARYWVEFWGVGCDGYVCAAIRGVRAFFRMFGGVLPCDEAPEPAPLFLAVWLLIIVDNTLHLAINHWALSL